MQTAKAKVAYLKSGIGTTAMYQRKTVSRAPVSNRGRRRGDRSEEGSRSERDQVADVTETDSEEDAPGAL